MFCPRCQNQGEYPICSTCWLSKNKRGRLKNGTKRCLLDMDGVLVNFVQGACDLHGVPNPYFENSNHGRFDIVKILGVDPNDFWSGMSESFWSNLEPMDDAWEILEIVESKFGLKNICLLSRPSTNPESLSGKLLWIKKWIPAYANRYLFGPKKHFCANSCNYLIDDYDGNVVKFREAGGNGILVPRPWNSNFGTETVDFIKESLW